MYPSLSTSYTCVGRGIGSRAHGESVSAGMKTTRRRRWPKINQEIGAHPEHEVQLVLPGRPIAHRREHPAEVLEVQVLEHLRDPRRQGRDGELGYGHQLVLADVPLVPLVQRSEALVKALDLAAVELAAAVLLHLLDIVLGQVQARRRESLRAERRGGDRSDASVFFTLRLRDRHEAGSRRARGWHAGGWNAGGCERASRVTASRVTHHGGGARIVPRPLTLPRGARPGRSEGQGAAC